MTDEQRRIDALDYHEFPTPGKISVMPTKGLANQRDLSLAYTPGVAHACTAIQKNPDDAARYTAALRQLRRDEAEVNMMMRSGARF